MCLVVFEIAVLRDISENAFVLRQIVSVQNCVFGKAVRALSHFAAAVKPDRAASVVLAVEILALVINIVVCLNNGEIDRGVPDFYPADGIGVFGVDALEFVLNARGKAHIGDKRRKLAFEHGRNIVVILFRIEIVAVFYVAVRVACPGEKQIYSDDRKNDAVKSG